MFVGGGLGASARYWLGLWISPRWGAVFPWSTTLINITGSLIIGLFMASFLKSSWSPDSRYFIAVGLLGGYTTFSTFSYETIGLLEQGSYSWALWYVLLNVLLSLAGCWLGMVIARALVGGA